MYHLTTRVHGIFICTYTDASCQHASSTDAMAIMYPYAYISTVHDLSKNYPINHDAADLLFTLLYCCWSSNIEMGYIVCGDNVHGIGTWVSYQLSADTVCQAITI